MFVSYFAFGRKNNIKRGFKMRQRLITAAISLVLLGIWLVLYNTVVFNVVVAGLCILALHEAYSAFKFKRAWPLFGALVIYTILIVYTTSVYISMAMPLSFMLIVFVALYTVYNMDKIDIAELSTFILFSIMIVSLFSSMAFIKTHAHANGVVYSGLYFIMIALGSSWGGDGAAYFAGRFLGKHKLAPLVSPNKTIEGAIGGVCGSVFVGVCVTAVWFAITGMNPYSSLSALTFNNFLIVALLCAVNSLLGILGDLWASAVKRHSGIKDYGTIFPGHGGIMDRFDSVLYIMPFMAAIVSIIL